MNEDEINDFDKLLSLEKETNKYSRLSFTLSSTTTTVRVYEKDISRHEMDVVNDNPAITCLVLEDYSDLVTAESKLKDKELNNIDDYNIIFINESFVEDFSAMMEHTLDTTGVLKKEEIVNEPTKILAG